MLTDFSLHMAENASICELYTKLALSSIITELRDEMGKNTRNFICNAARKRLGKKMFSLLDIDMESDGEPGDILEICKTIQDKGGPKVTCDMIGEEIFINIHECHLIEAAKEESFVCEITQGWIESMLFSMNCERMSGSKG